LRRVVGAAFLLLAVSCATTPRGSLSGDIESLIDDPPFHHAFWSILIEDDDGRVLYAANDDKLTIPASNRKLFAAATIANCLGITEQLSTTIWRDGDDLVVRGDGDPSLGSWRYERSNEFLSFAEALKQSGVTRVRDVIADVSAFDRVTIPGGWKYGNLGWDYAAPVDALAWEENELAGNRARLEPARSTAETLRDALIVHGIEVAGDVRVVTEPRQWSERIAVLPSPFIGQLLATVLKNSQNLYTEMLFKRSSDGTYDGSFALETGMMTGEVKIDDESFRFVDGSGLAPDNLVTPAATIALLRWMNHPTRRGFWWDTLAQPAQPGTLNRRLNELTDRLRGKTGTINGVNALSGIIAMPGGKYRYFSITVNHHDGESSEAVEMIDAIVRRVANDQ
jgi:D-alanyl-D-alanine carboxypeptidase